MTTRQPTPGVHEEFAVAVSSSPSNESSHLIEVLESAGAGMANICFNLSQDNSLPASVRQSMKTGQMQWDAALRALRAAMREQTPAPESQTHGDGERKFCDFPECGCSSGAAERCSHPPVSNLRGIAPDEAHANVLPSREDRGGQTDQLEALSFSAHLTPQMIRDTAYWEQLEDELRETLRRAANALEVTEEERAKQWRLRREAEASRDAARAVADSLAMARDTLRSALRDAADQLSRAHDDAFKQAAGYGLVTSDGREFSCYQLNLCQTAANKARAALATTEGSDNG